MSDERKMNIRIVLHRHGRTSLLGETKHYDRKLLALLKAILQHTFISISSHSGTLLVLNFKLWLGDSVGDPEKRDSALLSKKVALR
jgi:hypothetical protein